MPTYRERPNTDRLRAEVRSTARSVKHPIAAMMPNTTNMAPPTAGSGMVDTTAPSLPTTDNIMEMTPVAIRQERLAIWIGLY